MQAFAYQIDVYIDDDQLPRVRHIFYGRTCEEAERNFELHLEMDSFLKHAVVNERIGDMDCILVVNKTAVPFHRKGVKL